MIKFENVKVEGWEPAIRGMRNPMNSWEKSDSRPAFNVVENFAPGDPMEEKYWKWAEQYNSNIKIGPNDHDLMMKLAKAGSEHSKYRRMIVVWVDITAPLYWWKEFDTYKVGTVANSCSTMHKIHSKEFTLDDFSCEHLLDKADLIDPEYRFDIEKDIALSAINVDGDRCYFTPKGHLEHTCQILNRYREKFLEAKENAKKQKDESDRAKRAGQVPASSGRYFEMMAKKYWWQMIQLLPSSYNQRRTVMLNYEVLAGIYPKRKDHKLDEWHDFCDWIKSLPYSEIITLEE